MNSGRGRGTGVVMLGAAVVAAMVTATVVSYVGTATAAVDPNASNAHFIKISTVGAPKWSASADLYRVDKNGVEEVIYHWQESHSGNYALWRYHGDRSVNLRVHVSGTNTQDYDDVAGANVCFKIDGDGNVDEHRLSESNGNGSGVCTTA